MKRIIIFLFLVLTLTGCSKLSEVNKNDTNKNNTSDPNSKEEYYIFDVSKEWDADEYKKTHGQELNSFNAPILSPYKYTYKAKSKDMTIDEIAYKLGEIMMEALKRDYEGKTFTVTEYQDLAVQVMNEEECKEWVDLYSKKIKKVVIKENQWLCTFSCNYKYTGEYAGIGVMPSDWEWMTTLDTDGSGEDHVFIIQKNGEDEYIMRAMPKTVIEEIGRY